MNDPIVLHAAIHEYVEIIRELKTMNTKFKLALYAVSSANNSFASVKQCSQVAKEGLGI